MRPPVTLKERSGSDQVLLEMALPAQSEVFIDHFPGHPVLAGVFQIDWAIVLGAQYFEFAPAVATDFRVKFRRVIGPTNRLQLRLQWDRTARALSFEYRNEDEVASFGKIKVGQSR